MWGLCFALFQSAFAGDTQNVGSAKNLHGTTRLAVVFVSDQKSNWTWREQRIQKKRLRLGEHWIQNASLEYGVPSPRFRHRTYGRFWDIKLDELPEGTRSGNENVEMVHLVSRQLHFDSPKQWRETFADEQFAVLVFLKRDGASYAIPQEIGLDTRYDIEGAVLYENFEPGLPNCATCMAHEILHIFGAWDMYETFQITSEQMALARQLYPNSIMLRTSYTPSDVTLDPVTCWRIGWCTKPPQAESFRPIAP
jgi:hypothetical protein